LLFRYLGKLAENSTRVTASDISQLKGAGWSEEAIYDALTVSALFQFYNTWIDGSGVQAMSVADYVNSGKRLSRDGYCLDFNLKGIVKITANKFIAVVNALLLAGSNKSSEPSRQTPRQSQRELTSA
jgi:hypothetical protein